MKLLPSIFYNLEVGRARPLMRLIPLAIVMLGIVARYNMKIYKGLGDMPSMDNAQFARQIERHQGFNTYFIRPYALMQISAFKAKHGQAEMFPELTYTSQIPRVIPDTYNAPGYPLLLAGYFKAIGVDFDQTTAAMEVHHAFSGDRWIPALNEVFILLTACLMFLLGWRLFDERVAWMGSVGFVASEFIWNYSLLALPINLLMLLTTALFFGATELSRIAEEMFDHNAEDSSFGWAWLIVPGLAVLLGVICLNSLLLVALTLPLIVFLMLMRRTNWFFPFVVLGVVGLMVAPWFYHWYRACGNPLGSNLTLGLLGQGQYTGNQVYCATSIPSYDGLFRNFGTKQFAGFLYYFHHGWSLLGSQPLVLLFVASILHEFRRQRVQAFRWLVLGCAFAIVFMTNLGNPQPDALGDWNLVAILLPAMILIGTAFFFTLLDRMPTQLPLLTVTLVVATLALTFAPMVLGLISGGNNGYSYNYPPYLPPILSYVTRLSPANQWVTSDVPWATAWYGDRPSLWLPDSVSDFTNINDNVCESSLILFTPVTLDKPVTNLTSGEQKEWLPYVLRLNIPETFPLQHFVKFPGVNDYSLITNLGAHK
jgi:hypothetical protein